MNARIINTGLLSLGLVFVCRTLHAAAITAASCGFSDVQAATEVASSGDTVIIPEGECSWSNGITLNNKPLKIKGSGTENTIITYTENGTSWGEAAFWLNACADDFEISDLTFKRNSQSGKMTYGFIFLNGACRNWRIHHNRFWTDYASQNDGVRMIWIQAGSSNSQPYGLIDHNNFIGQSNSGTHQGVLVKGALDLSWLNPIEWGSGNSVYIEDNTFNFDDSADGLVDCSDGGRYVFRNNTAQNAPAGNHGYDSPSRSCMKMEIYGNDFICNQAKCLWAVQLRGGTALIHNNTFSGSWERKIAVTNYRSGSGYCEAYNNNYCPPKYECDGGSSNDGNSADENGTHSLGQDSPVLTDSTKTWISGQWQHYYVYNINDGSKCKVLVSSQSAITCTLSGGAENDWDVGDQYKITSGYPCRDQIGRGQNQLSEPVYVWDNGANTSVMVYDSYCGNPPEGWCFTSSHIQANRDYIVGVPKPGYVPYVYPHPLQEELVSDRISPANPNGLMVQ